MKIKEPFSVYSNIVFLIPLFFAILKNSYTHGFIIFLVFIFSILFHATKRVDSIWWNNTGHLTRREKIFLWTDTISACSLVLFNLFIFWQRNFPTEFYYAISILIVALIFFFFPRKNYDFSQGIWHILAGVMTLLAV